MEECLLPFELAKLSYDDPWDGNDENDDGGTFLVHLGDIKDGKKINNAPQECHEDHFLKISNMFGESPVMPFFIPGDNAWIDCADPTEAYSYWDDHLFHMQNEAGRGWPDLGADVYRHPERKELFAFLLRGVLFLGQSLPESPTEFGAVTEAEWEQLLLQNTEWLEENFELYSGRMRAVVIFAHGTKNTYFGRLEDLAADPEYGNPLILVLEDGDRFETEEGYRDLPNVLRASTDSTVTPVQVTVDVTASSLGEVFSFSRGCFCSTSHRPTELVEWMFGECETACVGAHEACVDKAVCSPQPCQG